MLLLSRTLFFMILMIATAPLVAPPSLHAQSPQGSGPEGNVPFVPNVNPTLAIRRAAGGIAIDGDLGDAGWQGVNRATNFAEIAPGDRTRPPVQTEAMMAYDDRNLYVAIIAYDDPSTIRATMHERDDMWNEDMCGLVVDTYGDAARAYEFFVNALGVQGDILWDANGEEDVKFDMVFSSSSRITANGYQVEMAIPFSSLRFPDRPVQNWKATFWRIHPRDSRREYSWAALNSDNSCGFCQYGSITGIENVKPGGALELLPSVVGFQSAELADLSNPDTSFRNSKIDGAASLGARYAFSPSVMAELTYNPDFSQVESDAAQVNVNTTFAISYPERRPFFQEGSDLFSTWFDAVYTRSINDPLAAAKLTARLGNTSLAYLGAYDENSPIIIPMEEQSIFVHGGRSLSNIVRARHAFADNSFIGALVTDRRFEMGGSGTLFSVDGQYRFSDAYHLELQALLTRTREAADSATGPVTDLMFDNRRHTARFDGESITGHGVYASLERNGRFWNFDLDYWDKSPGFRASDGFTTRNNERRIEGSTQLNFYPAVAWADKITPTLNVARIWNYDGMGKDMWIIPALEFSLKGQTWIRLAYLMSRENFRGIDFPGIRRFTMNANTNFTNLFSFAFNYTTGRSIARTLDTPVLGRGTDLSVWATIKPLERFNIQPAVDFSALYHPDGKEIYSGYIVRARFNYQFTHELFLRMVAQYDGFGRTFALEPLLTYKLNPFTIFYVGSTHDFAEFPEAQRYAPTYRQFFAKFQYLVQI